MSNKPVFDLKEAAPVIALNLPVIAALAGFAIYYGGVAALAAVNAGVKAVHEDVEHIKMQHHTRYAEPARPHSVEGKSGTFTQQANETTLKYMPR